MFARRAPLKQGKPLSRGKPMRRRSPNAVVRGVEPNADELAYWDTLGALCEGCDRGGDVVVHHILANAPGKGRRRDHMLVVKLCPDCHNMGNNSVHLLGSEAKFLEKTGRDLVAISVANRDDYLAGEVL